jgi:uncharacterized cupin superfamily protein
MQIEIRKPTRVEIDSANSWPIWSKEISEFPFSYGEKETCLILRGKAQVTTDSGENFEFGIGDWVVFPVGLNCIWKIIEPIEKKYNFG